MVEVGMEWECNTRVFKNTLDSRSIKSFIKLWVKCETTSDHEEILDGDSLQRGEHFYGVGFLIPQLDFIVQIKLNNHQRVEENKKSIALKASTNDDEEEESQSESDEDSIEEECTNEDASIYFMALEEHEDEVNSNSNYNEFQDVLQELYFDLEDLGLKNVSLKKQIYCLQNELNELEEKFENIEKTKISFEKENRELKKKNELLISSLQKLSNG
uniref:Uncharacterized protein n=1 Tax=Vitis vinifera TaxID=29760 RepID=A5BQB6_VITVI|nr:hypothetical protein VITISV_039567 [Vitis vinifera]